jgi:hypothetical protein
LRSHLLAGRSDLPPHLMAEAERSFPTIRAEATRSAAPEEIAGILAARFALYPQPTRTDAEWAAWWADYTNALDDLPPSAIEAGMAAYVKGPDSEFFPKPGRIRDLAKTTPNPLAIACDGLRRNLERQHRQLQIGRDAPPEPPAAKESVRDMLASFHKAMADRAPAKRTLAPPISGPVDERGLTQAMRDHMAQKDQRG